MADQIIEVLAKVLDPFDPAVRDEMLHMVGEEIRRHPLIDYVIEEDGTEWKIGEGNPCRDDATIFAMLLNEHVRTVHVYSVRVTATEEQGQTAGIYEYFCEMIFKPRRAHATCTGDSLYCELRAFTDDDEGRSPPPAATSSNGAGQPVEELEGE